MANGIEITITNNSGKIGEELEAAILRALEQCGEQAEKYAKQLAPVDTGALRNSITHQVIPDERAVYVGTANEYAIYQELGTGIHATGGGGRPTPWVYQDEKGVWHTTSGNKPKPFIKPALDDHREDYRKIIKSELEG